MIHLFSMPIFNTDSQMVKKINQTYGSNIVIHVAKLFLLPNNDAWNHWTGEIVGDLKTISQWDNKKPNRTFKQSVYVKGLFELDFSGESGETNFVKRVMSEIYSYDKVLAKDKSKILACYLPTKEVIKDLSELLSNPDTNVSPYFYDYFNDNENKIKGTLK